MAHTRDTIMTVAEVTAAFYGIRGVEFVEFDVKDRVLFVSVGTNDGRFDAVCKCQEDLDELLDIVEVHVGRALCDKKRSIQVKFVSNRV